MPSRQGSLGMLAEAVADGERIDWDHAESSVGSPEERQVVQQLRRLAGIGHAARALRQTWGPLQIRSEVGRGTFGTVYRAWDSRLDREVALKLLAAPPGGSRTASAVIREGQLLAKIRHPNVVSVYGADVVDGQVGIWMEFLTGRTLKEILETQGPFGAQEAAVIGRDVCGALAAVHRPGYLHRDIKAQNVMREAGGRTVLMDFGTGIAATPDGAGPPPLSGTPVYLAPEVLAGGPPTVQSDIYSVGVLLFYLVSGEFPVVAGSLEVLRDRHAHEGPRRLRDVRPDLPARFVRLVDAAIAPDPADRPQSAGAMEALLADALVEPGRPRPSDPSETGSEPRPAGHARRRPIAWIAVAMLTVLLSGLTFWAYRGTGAPAVPRNSLAVIPFVSSADVPELQEFVEAMSDDITVQLSRLPGVRLIARTSASRYRESAATPREIGRELNVAALVTGRVRVQEDALGVVVELVDTTTEQQLWTDTFSGSAGALDALQRRVARGIASALRGQLTQADSQALERRPMASEALQLYLRGRYLTAKRTPADLHGAIGFLNRALAIEPQAGLVHAALADAYLFGGLYGLMQSSQAHELSEAAALEALRLDASLAEAHAALASVYHEQWRFAEADAAYRRAVELNPNYAPAHHWYAVYLVQLRRFAEAHREIDHAFSLDPFSSAIAAAKGVILYQSRDFGGAARHYLDVLATDPGFVPAQLALAEAHTMLGRYEDALAWLARARGPGTVDERAGGLEAYIRAASGDRETARRLLAQTSAEAERPRQGEMDRAAAYDLLGDTGATQAAIRRALRAHDDSLVFAAVEPRWDRLRGTPAFQEVLDAMSLSTIGAPQ